MPTISGADFESASKTKTRSTPQTLSSSVGFTAVAVIGFVFLAGALFARYLGIADDFGLGDSGVLKNRLILGIVGCGLLAIGLLRRRSWRVYKTLAVLAVNSALIIFLLEAGATIVNRLYPANASSRYVDAPAIKEVAGSKVAPAMYVGWQGKPRIGEHVSIGEDGLRVTPGLPKTKDVRAIRVFAFGGSTMWGEGASDAQTIPAYLQMAFAAQIGSPVEVTNYGQRAWVSTQSLIKLMLELRAGNVPDVVVFYDGYNDTFSAYATGKIGVPKIFAGVVGEQSVQKKFLDEYLKRTDLGKLMGRTFRPLVIPAVDVPAMSQQVADNYLAIHQLVLGLGREYGFSTRFFWQPQLIIGAKPLTPVEKEMRESHPWLTAPLRNLSNAMRVRIAALAAKQDKLADLSDAFNTTTGQIYFDPCHINGVGNRRVADLMLERGLLSDVKAAVRARNGQKLLKGSPSP